MLAVFGFCMAIHYNSPWYIWAIGALCFYIDLKEDSKAEVSVKVKAEKPSVDLNKNHPDDVPRN